MLRKLKLKFTLKLNRNTEDFIVAKIHTVISFKRDAVVFPKYNKLAGFGTELAPAMYDIAFKDAQATEFAVGDMIHKNTWRFFRKMVRSLIVGLLRGTDNLENAVLRGIFSDVTLVLKCCEMGVNGCGGF